MLFAKTSIKHEDRDKLRVKGWKRYHENTNQKKVGVALLILHKIDFKKNDINGDKEGYFIMIKE